MKQKTALKGKKELREQINGKCNNIGDDDGNK
jgi:hypothetical protein